MAVRSELSQQRIHSCFFGSQSWVQFFPIAGLSSGQTQSQSYNLYLWELYAQESPEHVLLAPFIWPLCSYIFCCPNKDSDRAKQLHNQQINPEHISVSFISVSQNAPLTSHTSKTDPRRDTSYKNAPYKLKKPLLKKRVGLPERVLQHIYLCLAAPGAASKEKGVTRQAHIHLKHYLIFTEHGLHKW